MLIDLSREIHHKMQRLPNHPTISITRANAMFSRSVR